MRALSGITINQNLSFQKLQVVTAQAQLISEQQAWRWRAGPKDKSVKGQGAAGAWKSDVSVLALNIR